MNVAVIDHGMGNLRSVSKALEAAGARVTVTDDPSDIEGADALCVPGQGIFDRCMTALASRGLDDLVRDWIEARRPYLGICLGMQVLFDESEEREPHRGLGLLPGRVTRIRGDVRVPHIGWNTVAGDYFYFDHSFSVHPADDVIVRGWCTHGERFAAWIETGSVVGVQFHPEKSGEAGITMLREWIER